MALSHQLSVPLLNVQGTWQGHQLAARGNVALPVSASSLT